MRAPYLIASILAVGSSSFAQPADLKSGVEGQIVSAVTGGPLRKATVRLERLAAAEGVANSRQSAGGATITAADGRFSFAGLDPGAYRVLVSRPGYLPRGDEGNSGTMGAPVIRLVAGEVRKDVSVKLVPLALIHGRVVDEDGDPVVTAQVQVYRSVFSKGKRQYTPFYETSVQGDASFVIGNLPPGRFYISARDLAGESPTPGRKSAGDVFVATYYPSTVDSQQAGPIVFAAGAEVRGIEIRLRTAHPLHIAGKAINTVTGGAAASISLTLRPKAGGGGSQTISTDAQGRFSFEGVQPGAYLIQSGAPAVSFTFSGNTRQIVKAESFGAIRDLIEFSPDAVSLVGSVAVQAAANIDDLMVPLGEGLELTGRILRPEGPAEGAFPGLILVADDGGSDTQFNAEVQPDGTFQFHRLPPGMYVMTVENLSNAAYLKAVRYGGRDAANRRIELATDGSAAEVVLGANPAAVGGVVRDAKGEVAPGTLVQVFTADGEFRQVVTDENGRFQVAGLPPADYRVIAWEAIDDDLLNDATFRTRFEGQATKVTLAEGGREIVEVKQVARDAIDAEAVKVR